jgi:hypothetical protein
VVRSSAYRFSASARRRAGSVQPPGVTPGEGYPPAGGLVQFGRCFFRLRSVRRSRYGYPIELLLLTSDRIEDGASSTRSLDW